MAWVRWGDSSAMHPTLLNVYEHPDLDDRLLNEVHGFVSRCASQSGAHLTDYVVTLGTAIALAGQRAAFLIDVAVFAGLMSPVEDAVGGQMTWKLKDDDPDFLHLRSKAEVEWEQQRKKDNERPNLIVPVRLRDGDACRWCGCIVDWFDRKSGRAGTYDHLRPGEPADIDTYVVSCKSCNSSRRDGALPAGCVAVLPPPTEPYFSQKTIQWLTENKWRKSQNLPVPATSAGYLRPGDRADTQSAPDQPSETERSRTRVAHSAPSGDRSSVSDTVAPAGPDPQQTRVAHSAPSAPTLAGPVVPGPQAADNGQTRDAPSAPSDRGPAPPRATQPDLADISRYQPDSADRHSTGSNRSGRVGSGRVGSPDQPTSSKVNSPRRTRRGGRRRSNPRER